MSLRQRMVRHADIAKHPSPDDIASEYVCRLLEGYHQRATIAQAYIDICRLQTGRKGQPGYEAKKTLNMLAISEEQMDSTFRIPAIEDLSVDDRLDLERAFSLIKCARTKEMFTLYLKGHNYGEIALIYELTESRVHQILNREMLRLSDRLNR